MLPLVFLVGCSDDSSPSGGVTTLPEVALPPEALVATDFVDAVTHPHFPLEPGTTWTYEVTGDSEETIVVTVLEERRDILGISATVVHDVVTDASGTVIEDTYDWYAQDVDGNVWYLGEDTTAFEDGSSSKAGSWEAGVDGARAGIVMPAAPEVGMAYQQEYLAGEAEDQAEIMDVGARLSIGLGDYDDVVVTNDFTPLELDVLERKYYAPGVGLIFEESLADNVENVELVGYLPWNHR
jgi:hypothetical protein